MEAYIKVRKKNKQGVVVAFVYFYIAVSSGIRSQDLAYFNGLSQLERKEGCVDSVPVAGENEQWVLWQDEPTEEIDVIYDPDYESQGPGGPGTPIDTTDQANYQLYKVYN